MRSGWSAEALRRARRRFEAEHGDITLEAIGERVGALLGTTAPSVQVLSYIFGGREPRFAVGVALARVLNADPWELAKPAATPAEALAPVRPGRVRKVAEALPEKNPHRRKGSR